MKRSMRLEDLGNTAKAYVINLDTRTDRLESFNKRFARFNFPIERVAASTPSSTIDWQSDPEVPESALAAETATTVSHYRVYKNMIDEQLDWALVLEDDADPVPDLPRRIKHVLKLWPEDAWYVQLGYVRYEGLGLRGTARALAAYVIPSANELRIATRRDGTHMSIVTIEFARYIVERLRPATLAFDVRLRQLREEGELGKHAYLHVPCLARQIWSRSDIQPDPEWQSSRSIQRWNL
jgi:GR25 family glycosyltransferase involved in LPS biosynthesis